MKPTKFDDKWLADMNYDWHYVIWRRGKEHPNCWIYQDANEFGTVDCPYGPMKRNWIDEHNHCIYGYDNDI